MKEAKEIAVKEDTLTALSSMKKKHASLGRLLKIEMNGKLAKIIDAMLPKLNKDKDLMQGIVKFVKPDEVLSWTNSALGSLYHFILMSIVFREQLRHVEIHVAQVYAGHLEK